ncbi:MAG: heme-binding protein [Desulfobacterales bacterium]|nr:heme-binding protein [Desulfobacterales bacterium]
MINTKSIKILMSVSFGVIVWLTGSAFAVEEASHEVITKDGQFELRQYQPFIIAETIVEGDFKEVGSKGFRRLADYIGGNNHKELDIAMTAPVTQEATSEKIAMTAPVTQTLSGDQWRISFVMPAEYRLDTLPVPIDDRIAIREVPSNYLVAVVRYSGSWSKDRYAQHRAKLIDWINEQGLQPMGNPVWARYNPPFMPWFLRRNEVWIPVKQE